MNRFPDDDEDKDWENPDLPEGFDVYDYDPVRARRGQRMVLFIFALVLVLLIVAAYRGSFPVRYEHVGRP
jgi:hypothetical protein